MEVLEAHRQRGYRVRLEWGPEGAALLAAECAVVVVVDVLSFCTSVDVAVGRGAAVLPQRPGPGADAQARARGAQPAGDRSAPGPSLRPSSLLGLAAGTRIALPSPNGSALCALAAGGRAEVVAGCLRNASAVSRALRDADGPVGLVPAGERWPDGTLRVAWEDALGAGAIAAGLAGRSPEADAAASLFAGVGDLAAALHALASGRELVADGFGADVALAADHDASTAVPRLRDGFLADAVVDRPRGAV